MYDLILCVLATTKNDRLSSFSKIGYKKSNKFNCKVVYLVDNEQKPDFIQDDWCDCFGHSHATRLVEYLKNTKEEFRWIMQVDDDSCTDIDKTIELLDYFYDHQDPVMLTGSSSYFPVVPRYVDQTNIVETCFSHTIDPKLQQVLRKIKIENLFVGTDDLNNFNVIPHLCHGWEQNVFSKSAVEKVKNYAKLQEYIDACLEFKPVFSDEVPFMLARAAKVPISQCYFFSPLPNIEEYTGVNKTGRFSHIHHVCEPQDRVQHLEEIIDSNLIFENSQEVNEYFEKNINNTDWFFFNVTDEKISSRCAIKLKNDHSIDILKVEINCFVATNSCSEFSINHNHEKFNLEKKSWRFHEDKIMLKNENDQELVLSKIKDKLYGVKIAENDYVILSKISPVDTVYWSHKRFFGRGTQRIN